MTRDVSELERLAGIVMAVERVTFTEAILRGAEHYPLLRAAAMSALKQREPTIPKGCESSNQEE